MDNPSDSELKKLLQEVENLIHHVEDQVSTSIFSQDQTALGPEGIRREIPADGASLEPFQDARMELFVAEDALKATADFFPPSGDGLFLTFDAVELQLLNRGLVQGIDWPAVKEALTDCNLNGRIVRDVVVARGTPAVDEVPERWQIVESLVQKKKQLDESLLQVDFKAVSPFLVVSQNEVLAEILPEVPGQPGTDVFAKEIPHSVKVPELLQPGKNVTRGEGNFTASRPGVLKIEKGTFFVEEILVLKEGVDYRTGHIHFTGDVAVEGEIKPGFQIHAQGGVSSNQTMDVTEIFCQGDVVSPGGLIGAADGAFVRTEGLVRAKFMENLSVFAKADVMIQASVHNCQVKTLGRLQMGEKGILLGGHIMAQNGADVFQVGHDNGARAEFHCGMDFTALDKLIWAREQIVSLGGQYKVLEHQLKDHPAQGGPLMEAQGKIRNQIGKLNEVCRVLVDQVDRNEEASVTVRGTIFPGNMVEICHVHLVVPKALSKVRFTLDKSRGQILVTPL